MQQHSRAPGQLSQQEVPAVPLLDDAVLDRLQRDLDDDRGLWKVFVSNFIAYLPIRLERLRVALTTGDVTGSLDAVLGLKTASQMVGAERLAGLALTLEQAIRTDSTGNPARALPQLAVTHLGPIDQCRRQTAYPLLDYLASK
jgi:histidine phosphotransfer protein HptB